MLCDEVQSLRTCLAAGHSKSKVFGYDKARIVVLTDAIKQAKKFVLDDTLVEAATHVAFGRPSSIENALAYARMPFDQMWIEWSENAQLRALSQSFPRALTQISPDVLLKTKRKGLLVLREHALHDLYPEEGFRVTAWMVSSPRVARPELPVSLSLGTINFMDLPYSPVSLPMPEWREENLSLLPHESSQERQARFRISRDAMYKTCPYWRHATLKDLREEEIPDDLPRMIDQEMSGPLAELHFFLLSILILFNTRNGVTYTDSDLGKLNKSRAKSGKPPLLDHRTVHLRLSDREVSRLGPMSDADRRAARSHIVRGHFKTRKSGVYWWRPFVRGDAKTGTVTHDYRVSL